MVASCGSKQQGIEIKLVPTHYWLNCLFLKKLAGEPIMEQGLEIQLLSK